MLRERWQNDKHRGGICMIGRPHAALLVPRACGGREAQLPRESPRCLLLIGAVHAGLPARQIRGAERAAAQGEEEYSTA
jgi:hypothetical protein